MASVASNLPAIATNLRRLSQALNLRRMTRSGRVGDGLLKLTAEVILYRSHAQQVDPEGRPWRRLSPAYLRWKLRHGFDPRKNLMTGEMLTYEEVLGETVVTSDSATMTEGLDDFTRAKTEWTEEGQPAKNRPARPYYDLGPTGEPAIEEYLDGVIDNHLKDLGA